MGVNVSSPLDKFSSALQKNITNDRSACTFYWFKATSVFVDAKLCLIFCLFSAFFFCTSLKTWEETQLSNQWRWNITSVESVSLQMEALCTSTCRSNKLIWISRQATLTGSWGALPWCRSFSWPASVEWPVCSTQGERCKWCQAARILAQKHHIAPTSAFLTFFFFCLRPSASVSC